MKKMLKFAQQFLQEGKKNANGFANPKPVLLLNDIQEFVKNGL